MSTIGGYKNPFNARGNLGESRIVMSLDSSQKALKICTDKMEERRVYSAVEM
jgi:hypothetical protein